MAKATHARFATGLAVVALVTLGASHRARAAGVVTICDEGHLNTALSGGGLVTFTCGPATITVTSTKTISADTTIDGGGTITLSSTSTTAVFEVIADVQFTVRNFRNLTSAGEGIANDSNSGSVTVTNCTVSGNGGAGIANNSDTGSVTVTECTVSGNGGAGIADNSGSGPVTVTNCTVSGNGFEGIVNNSGTGSVTVTNCAVSGNTEEGIANNSGSGPVTVTNCTVSGNSEDGIVNNSGTGLVTVTNCTVSGNTEDGIANNSGSALSTAVTNTILANNTPNCGGTITDGGHNLEDGTTCAFRGTGCSTTTGTSFCNTNPDLDPAGLANNGGPTQTIAVRSGSPAINAGDEAVCAVPPVDGRDQRGFVRPGDGNANCTIGAYEFDAHAPAAGAQAPAVSPVGLVALGLLLSALGSRAVRRRT